MQQGVGNKPGPKPVFTCPTTGCKATFRKKLRLQDHMTKHTGQKPFRCDKPGCGKMFFQKSKLQCHLQKHLGVKKYICSASECRAAFLTKRRLKYHQQCKHGNTGPLTCSVSGCFKTFHKKKALKNHLSEHKVEPRFACDQAGCEWKGPTSASLTAHRRRHAGYRCPFPGCQATSPTWSTLQKHRKQHPLDLLCPKCKKSFTKEAALRRHKVTHLDKKVTLTCPREDCKLTFTTVFNLTHHVRKEHLCLQPYHCYHAGCNRTFAMRESLLRHLVVHDPNKKKMKLKFNLKPSKKHFRRALCQLPVVEQDLSRLFNQKLCFRSKTLLESNLSILFNERLLRDPADPEVNLSNLFQRFPVRPEKTA
ncbi:PREDICTED: P43 5S RNA-binding protein-like [Nanorana parkeri]|uniref:P43 5S RNA-binding protein-like n=1 Tax=Nanorana parkeri TaxID=125878 RepID=UPI000854CD70|nr:PREDICTED: P43 5S RNA-binding protein-like [Nanorana parkeri]